MRQWREFDINEVKQHLMLAGELTANCENCQQLAIDFNTQKRCPQCNTEFKYISFRTKNRKEEELFAIFRLQEKRPDLIVIDYNDIKWACGKTKAQDIFNL